MNKISPGIVALVVCVVLFFVLRHFFPALALLLLILGIVILLLIVLLIVLVLVFAFRKPKKNAVGTTSPSSDATAILNTGRSKLMELRRLGLRDIYPRSGVAAQLLDAYGLSVADIVAAAKDAMVKE